MKQAINVSTGISSLGYGVVGLNVLRALHNEGKNPALFPIGFIEASETLTPLINACLERAHFYDPTVPSLRIFHQFALAQHVGKGTHAGFPIFELDRFTPNELHHLRNQDLLFVPSAWGKTILESNGIARERVVVAPLGVDPAVFSQVGPGPDTTTNFINVGKWEIRKGHGNLIKAFLKAFGPNDNVRLVMACHNPCIPDPEKGRRYNEEWRKLYLNHPLREKVVVLDQRLPSQENVAFLMSQADCGVFPALAEGWNLELGEMLAMGKHVITTDYSAHTEYVTAANARLIKIDRLESAFDGIWFHGQGNWAYFGPAQEEQLITHLREIHQLKQSGELTDNTVGVETMRGFTWQKTAKTIAHALGV